MRAAVLYFPRWHQHEWISLCHNEKDSIFGIVLAIALAKSKCFLCHLDAAKVIRMVTHTMYGMTYAEKTRRRSARNRSRWPSRAPKARANSKRPSWRCANEAFNRADMQFCSTSSETQSAENGKHQWRIRFWKLSECAASYDFTWFHTISYDFIRLWLGRLSVDINVDVLSPSPSDQPVGMHWDAPLLPKPLTTTRILYVT